MWDEHAGAHYREQWAKLEARGWSASAKAEWHRAQWEALAEEARAEAAAARAVASNERMIGRLEGFRLAMELMRVSATHDEGTADGTADAREQ